MTFLINGMFYMNGRGRGEGLLPGLPDEKLV